MTAVPDRVTVTPLVIRDATPADHEAIATITVEAYRADDLGTEHYLSKLADVADRAEHTTLLVAEANGEVIGTVSLALTGPYAEIASGEEEGSFRMLAVAPAARGLGAGRALTEECMRRARATGLHRLVISSQHQMTFAHRIYEALGFVHAPDRDWEPAPGITLRCYTREL